ncbi:IS3 family transposase [Myroides phaeus]|uniref:IS3 family transposase n=1 Tax=Myroides phaeus TaxID=702745 RepID=UPI0021CEB7AD|nr:IS3 family transposase [Myroides phaeus]
MCKLFGKTRSAYYQSINKYERQSIKDDIILQEVLKIRTSLPKVGTRKLQYMLQERLATHKISIGRDYLFDLLDSQKMLIRQRKRKAYTTDSRAWRGQYLDLYNGVKVIRPEQFWVSDITYIRLNNAWGYLSLITDAYSHKIMGYSFNLDLTTKGCLKALTMALKNRMYTEKLIHHSDRGCQYCSATYTQLLIDNDISISTTQSGEPRDNAVAERVNGIIKGEFNLNYSSLGYQKTKEKIGNSIEAYNQIRPHDSCDRLTPNQAHLKTGVLPKRWKNYYKNKTEKKELVQQ